MNRHEKEYFKKQAVDHHCSEEQLLELFHRGDGSLMYNVRKSLRGMVDGLDLLAERSELKQRIERVVEGGMVAIHKTGMDCDCSTWDYVEHERFRGVFAHEREWQEYMDGAEGPQSMGFHSPSHYPEQSESRDLALEAFEDGHPHYVSY